MSQTNPLPTFAELANALKKTDSPFDAAEAHGFLCGLICITPGELEINWQKLVTGSKENARSTSLLQDLYEATYHEMCDFSFEFALVLPSDSVDIQTRTESLGLWCQGFLIGLQQSPTAIDTIASDEMAEALNDLTEIAQVDSSDLSNSEDEETAYYELVEYVRLVALMVYHELQTEKPNISTESDNSPDVLH